MRHSQDDLRAPRVELARWIYSNREHRPAAKVPDLLGEPAWDILIDLYINQTLGRRIAVSAACVASRAPFTTALRHIRLLCEAGVMRRVPDKGDRRRLWLELSEDAMQSMDAYLDRSFAEITAILRKLAPQD